MKRNIITVLILLIAAAGLFAQTLSLEDARTMALLNSRTLPAKNLAINSANLTEQSRIYSAYMPTLSLGGKASLNLWESSSALKPAPTVWDSFSASASANISESIKIQGNRNSIEKAINAIGTESAKIDARIEYFNVLDSADSAYYAVLEAMATLEAEEQSLQQTLTNFSMAEIRQQSGMLNDGDFLKAQADKETRENSRNQAKRNLAIAVSKLKFLLGLDAIPQPEQIDFTGYDALITRLAGISDDEADNVYRQFLQMLYSSNPTYAKYGLADQRAVKNLDLAKLGYAPTVTGAFSTGASYTYKNGFDYDSGTLSLSVNIPLDFWDTANNVERNRISRESAAMDYKGAEIQLQTDLQSALLSLIGYSGSIQSYRRSLEYAQKNYEYVMERYKLSQSSVSDLGDATTLLITSRNNLTNAQYSFMQSLSKLRSLGAIDSDERLLSLLMGNTN
ncbi:MAG: TolC family protein [Treponema sp.]|nr:TolC family protein [Treponema sp.]